MELRPALIDAAATHLKRGRRTSILVRHAERGAITDLSRHHEVLLTPQGHRCAASSGERLAAAVDALDGVALFHSPIERCKETAVGLHKGLTAKGKQAVVVGERHAFGASYLKDDAGLARAFLRHGRGFVRAWFDGDIDAAFIDPCDIVAQRQLLALREELELHPFVVAVSHDWNIAALKEHTLGLRHEDHGWPQFLDGVVAWVDGNKLVIDPA
ncbi:MAG: histidine phosphatase family protein [Deltaproteobacteria bacterium]|nr:histidine phosphatase family protein [Deltaproteobacteria bacterium]